MQIKSCAKQLSLWYNVNKRDLPFRHTRDPYKIWISEVMLQQTQVKTVIPYYNKWINKFPTLQSVANAKLDSLLKIWEGLGYYRRCINFHKAVKIVLRNYDGKVPSDYDTIIKLPGIGVYTAGAVLSIAFDEKVPAVDANVSRVISRLQCKEKIINTDKMIYETVKSMLNIVKSPGNLNQSIMELGALICTSKNPKCTNCPIINYCNAFSKNKIHQFPKIIKNKSKPHYNIVVGMIWKGDRFYIQKRSIDSMLAGLWEFPGGRVKQGESLKQVLIRKIKDESGLVPRIGSKIDSIKHSYSHFSISLHCFQCFIDNEKFVIKKKYKWIKPLEIKNFSFPKANHKLFNLISANNWYV